MLINGLDTEKKTAVAVAESMAAAARTAPKGCGIDNLEVYILDGDDKNRLAAEMKRIGVATDVDFFVRDGVNVENAHVVLLLGAVIEPIFCPNCGFCGFENCEENLSNDGICTFNTTDLGIALGSAVSIAADNRMDNRILFSGGKAAMSLGIFSNKVKVAYAIPLSTSSKSPFFDRVEQDKK